MKFSIKNYDWHGERNFEPIKVEVEMLPPCNEFSGTSLEITRSGAEFVYCISNQLQLPIAALLSFESLDDHCVYSNFDEYDGGEERRKVQVIVERAIKKMSRRK